MKLSCCVWALDLPEAEMLQEMQALGFHNIDIQPSHLRLQENRQLAAELGMSVSCLGASFGMPAGASLDNEATDLRDMAIRHIQHAIDHAAAVDADTAYLVPGTGESKTALRHFADEVEALAEFAASRDVKLAVEHFPGTALATAAATLRFIRDIAHPNLYLLYDSGHIQMSGEDPARVINEAGDRLGFVHFDDNDGVLDLHLGLLDGVMTEADLRVTLLALGAIGYGGSLSLELSPALDDALAALRRSRDILLRIMAGA